MLSNLDEDKWERMRNEAGFTYVVMAGGPVDGFRVYGLFASKQAASDWIMEYCFNVGAWIVVLESAHTCSASNILRK